METQNRVNNKMSNPKIDLSLLRTLVTEFEGLISSAEVLQNEPSFDKNTYIAQLSKAAGVASSLMQEAALLVMDCQHEILGQSKDPAGAKMDLLSSLLSPLKGTSNSN